MTIKDIKGDWNLSNYDVNNQKQFEGQILLEEDGWFEGIVNDLDSELDEERFVYGVYKPNKVMRLFKYIPHLVSTPFIFHVNNNFNGYDGEVEAVSAFGVLPLGYSHIEVQNVDKNENKIKEEIELLQAKIKLYKKYSMDVINKDFYNSSMKMKNEIIKEISENDENDYFNECNNILKLQKK